MPTIPLDIFEEGLTQLIALDEKWIPTGEQSSLYVRPCMFATEEHVGFDQLKSICLQSSHALQMCTTQNH